MQRNLISKDITESLKLFIEELQGATIGERHLTRLTIDVKSEQCYLEFDKAEVPTLESYEDNIESKKKEWKDEFDLWIKKHYGRINDSDYYGRARLELELILKSGFLLPDGDVLTTEQLKKSADELEDCKIDRLYADKYALLCNLIDHDGCLFSFLDTNAINKYLEYKGKSLSPENICDIVRFKYMMQLIQEKLRPDENDEPLIKELTPIFYDDVKNATEFCKNIKDMTNSQITTLVNELVSEKKISDISRKRTLYLTLFKYGKYTATESNWNIYVK